MEIPYDFINILAFSVLKKYENKNSLTIANLNNFYYAFLDYGIGNLNASNEDALEEMIITEEDNLEEELHNFLDNFAEYFYMKDNIVYLNEDVSYDTLENLLNVFISNYEISEYFLEASEFPSVLRTLEIHTIYDTLQNYLTNERKLFLQYKHQDFKSKSALFLRAMFHYNTGNLPNEVIMAMKNISYNMTEDDPNFDYHSKPISLDLWQKFETSSEEDDILDNLYEGMQFAIFGNGTLIYLKLDKILSDMLDEKYCLVEESGEPQSEIDYHFYLKYIEKIHKYKDKYGMDDYLEKAKWRLLYMLDNPNLCLYQENNLLNAIENANVEVINPDNFTKYADECRFFAHEIFNTDQDRYTLRKLLMIASYYDLTMDEEIINIINQYHNDEMYDVYCKIIFDLDKNKELKKEK